jgi:NTP pyrophosphatase (non-canonical NTP hydrolase)
MEFKTYQNLAKTTAVYPEQVKYLYPLLGLFGETGEIIEKARKNIHFVGLRDAVIPKEAADRLNRIDEILSTVVELAKEAEGIKKHIRKYGLGADISTILSGSSEDLHELKKELGDQMWYQAATCSDFGLDMADVALTNYNKLKDRMERNVINGSGDSR